MQDNKKTQKRNLSRRILSSIRIRMILIYVISTLLMVLTSIFILITSGNLIKRMDDMFSANVKLKEFVVAMDAVDEHLKSYLATDNSDSQLKYFITRDEFHRISQNLYDPQAGVYNEDDLLIKDIFYLVESYLAETDAAMTAKMYSDADYITRYAEADRVAGYIKKYADRLNLNKVSMNTRQYIGMSEDLGMMNLSNTLLLISIIGLNLLVISNMTFKITKPIIKLAGSAGEISRGNFDVDDIEVPSADELSVMANAFNGMKHSIKDYIAALHDKADTESQLLAQQIENLKIQSLLVDAEMKALQMQINPHFLFNTLNAGVQLAMLEGAERTSGFLEDLSRMFRYNVKSLSRKVKIKEEIDSVRAYGNLFYVRFGDIIKFNYNIHCSLLDIDVPPLIIQPLVENATIHGIGNLEQGGIITVTLEKGDGVALITVEDNGVGMDEETLQSILAGQAFDKEKSGHTTGIGVHNVLQRLRLFFGVHDIMEIISRPGHGAKFILKIPLGAPLDAQAAGEEIYV